MCNANLILACKMVDPYLRDAKSTYHMRQAHLIVA
jgi:hypothetical protein